MDESRYNHKKTPYEKARNEFSSKDQKNSFSYNKIYDKNGISIIEKTILYSEKCMIKVLESYDLGNFFEKKFNTDYFGEFIYIQNGIVLKNNIENEHKIKIDEFYKKTPPKEIYDIIPDKKLSLGDSIREIEEKFSLYKSENLIETLFDLANTLNDNISIKEDLVFQLYILKDKIIRNKYRNEKILSNDFRDMEIENWRNYCFPKKKKKKREY